MGDRMYVALLTLNVKDKKKSSFEINQKRIFIIRLKNNYTFCVCNLSTGYFAFNISNAPKRIAP